MFAITNSRIFSIAILFLCFLLNGVSIAKNIIVVNHETRIRHPIISKHEITSILNNFSGVLTGKEICRHVYSNAKTCLPVINTSKVSINVDFKEGNVIKLIYNDLTVWRSSIQYDSGKVKVTNLGSGLI